MIRVLVVDDHELVRSGITRMLADNPDIEVIGQASSGEDAIDFVRQQRPDIVLMDIRMPGIGGLEATRRILRIDDSIRVIVVTACADDPYPTRVMQSGATAYITKGADIKEMVRAIRMAHTGQRYISPEIAQKMALKQLGGGDRDEDGRAVAVRPAVRTGNADCHDGGGLPEGAGYLRQAVPEPQDGEQLPLPDL